MKEIYLPETACKMVKAILKRGEPAVIRQNVLLACDGNRLGVYKLNDTVDKPTYVTPDILDTKGTHVRIMDNYMLTYGDSKYKQIAYDQAFLYDATFCDLYYDHEFFRAPYIKAILNWHNVNWKSVIPADSKMNAPFSKVTPFAQIAEIIDKMDAKQANVNMLKDDCAIITVSENCIVVVMGYRY